VSPLLRDVLIAFIGGLPGLILAFIAWRKVPSEIDTAEAKADKAQHEATESLARSAKTLADSLCEDVQRLSNEMDEATEIIVASRAEIAQLKKDLGAANTRADSADSLVQDLRKRLVDAETRLAVAESRTAEADRRASEFRTELIKVGTLFDQSRREHQRQIDELVLVIETLLEQVEQLGGRPNVDKAMLERIANMSRRTNGEQAG
jgi:chromosome segregation ATPase